MNLKNVLLSKEIGEKLDNQRILEEIKKCFHGKHYVLIDKKDVSSGDATVVEGIEDTNTTDKNSSKMSELQENSENLTRIDGEIVEKGEPYLSANTELYVKANTKKNYIFLLAKRRIC